MLLSYILSKPEVSSGLWVWIKYKMHIRLFAKQTNKQNIHRFLQPQKSMSEDKIWPQSFQNKIALCQVTAIEIIAISLDVYVFLQKETTTWQCTVNWIISLSAEATSIKTCPYFPSDLTELSVSYCALNISINIW